VDLTWSRATANKKSRSEFLRIAIKNEPSSIGPCPYGDRPVPITPPSDTQNPIMGSEERDDKGIHALFYISCTCQGLRRALLPPGTDLPRPRSLTKPPVAEDRSAGRVRDQTGPDNPLVRARSV
jgi:hypothetical protein